MARQKQTLSPEQDRAANPLENVWVQANAGTGKTSILVRRLLRILFRTNNPGILCLTYTNAGASEIRNRILSALQDWAMADDETLRELLSDIVENKKPTDDNLTRAREVFYIYIDNPDMLKIKTIHGFCEEILHRFPIEVGISPSWKLIQDSNQKILLNDAFHKLINRQQSDAVADAFAHIVGRISEQSFDELLDILTAQYRQFFGTENLFNYRKHFIDTTQLFLDLDSPKASDYSFETLQNIIDLTKNDINTSKKPAGYLIDVINLTEQYINNTINFDEYKTAYLTANDTKISNVAKKDYLIAEQERVHKLNQQKLNKKIFDDTLALFDLASAFAQTYRDLKLERNVLDFDDLILYTRKLFLSPENMGWVLSQLDTTLSHILVDEAQDTSPEQWDILHALSGDFFVDGTTKSAAHSLFIVGDTKQSIYGFQGADPMAFATSRDKISAQIRENLHNIAEIPLTQSFRSAATILKTVDFFFHHSDIKSIAGFINNDHRAFRENAPGVVEIYRATPIKNEN